MKKIILLFSMFLVSVFSVQAQNLDVEGSVKIVDGTEGDGKVLTSDANGVATWQTPTGGGSSLWSSDADGLFYNSGNVGIGINSTAANNLYVYREDGVTGADTSTIYAYRYGANGATNGGSSWGVTGVDSAIKGYSYYGNAYSAGISAYSYLDFSNSTAFVAASHDGSNAAHLAYRDAQSKLWSGHFDGDMYISGDVGIGETTPTEKLDVLGYARFKATTAGDAKPTLVIQKTNCGDACAQPVNTQALNLQNTNPTASNNIGIGFSDVDQDENPSAWIGTKLIDKTNHYGDIEFKTRNASGLLNRMTITSDGKVRIGTTATPSVYMFSVDGKAIVEELVVELSGDWPDYVFEEAYDLAPLSEVQSFIDENGHLPNVPSAATLEAGDGIAVGEMQRIMMEKIEELTLYMIEMEAKNEALTKEVEALKQK